MNIELPFIFANTLNNLEEFYLIYIILVFGYLFFNIKALVGESQ